MVRIGQETQDVAVRPGGTEGAGVPAAHENRPGGPGLLLLAILLAWLFLRRR